MSDDRVIYENRAAAEEAARAGETVDWSQVKGDDGLTDDERRQRKHRLGEYAEDDTRKSESENQVEYDAAHNSHESDPPGPPQIQQDDEEHGPKFPEFQPKL